MRRFDESGRLDHGGRARELPPAHLAQLAGTPAPSTPAAAAPHRTTRFGARSRCWRRRRRTSSNCASCCRRGTARVEQLARWTEDEFARRAADFAARKEGGFIREGHGDLHLGNLVLIDGRVTPFDCIEFNEDFRWNDPASEIAFVWIDLLDHGRPGLAAWFLNAWLEAGGRFRGARRAALLRRVSRRGAAKIAALRARQEDADAAQATSSRRPAATCDLAWKIAVPPAPTLVITCGLSGSGKTTASSARLLDPTPEAAGSSLCACARTSSASACSASRRMTAATRRRRRHLHRRGDGAHLCPAAGAEPRAASRRLAGDRRRRLPQARRARQLCALAAKWRRLRHPRHRGAAEELRRRLLARRGDASEATVMYSKGSSNGSSRWPTGSGSRSPPPSGRSGSGRPWTCRCPGAAWA
jgi:hypothetical protein